MAGLVARAVRAPGPKRAASNSVRAADCTMALRTLASGRTEVPAPGPKPVASNSALTARAGVARALAQSRRDGRNPAARGCVLLGGFPDAASFATHRATSCKFGLALAFAAH